MQNSEKPEENAESAVNAAENEKTVPQKREKSEKRGQFTFYESFAMALRRIRRLNERCHAYDAIVNYALYGTEPEAEKLGDTAAVAFELIRPHLDSSRRKAEAGKKGGLAQESGSGGEADGKQSASKKEKENENEKENEYEYEYEGKGRRRARRTEPHYDPVDLEKLKGVLESL